MISSKKMINSSSSSRVSMKWDLGWWGGDWSVSRQPHLTPNRALRKKASLSRDKDAFLDGTAVSVRWRQFGSLWKCHKTLDQFIPILPSMSGVGFLSASALQCPTPSPFRPNYAYFPLDFLFSTRVSAKRFANFRRPLRKFGPSMAMMIVYREFMGWNLIETEDAHINHQCTPLSPVATAKPINLNTWMRHERHECQKRGVRFWSPTKSLEVYGQIGKHKEKTSSRVLRMLISMGVL